MIVKDPRVTLEDEARGITEDSLTSGFLDWLMAISVVGDDGKKYWYGCSPLILKLEQMDVLYHEMSYDEGVVVQDPKSIYKIAKFPLVKFKRMERHQGGSYKVVKLEDRVIVDIGFLHVECYEDNSWRYVIDDKENNFKADFYHRPSGGPLWYGKDTPCRLTQHSITYGYNWCGKIEGTFTFGERVVHIKGAGIRERYVAVDSSAAEIGGWEDWGWFHFDEVFGSMFEFKLGMKDLAINLVEENKYIPSGNLNIEHHDWAFLPQYGGFIPTVYKVTMETEEGILAFTAHVVSARTWGVTGDVPDNPVATLEWDNMEGTFTFKDGRVKVLTNGMGGVSIRQWRAYPNITPLSLGGANLDYGVRMKTC